LENVFSSKANLPINKVLKGERATTARKELIAGPDRVSAESKSYRLPAEEFI